MTTKIDAFMKLYSPVFFAIAAPRKYTLSRRDQALVKRVFVM